MSAEPPPSTANQTDDSGDYSATLDEGNVTLPAEEILNGLDQGIRTEPNSQEEEAFKQEPKPEKTRTPLESEWQALRKRLRETPHDIEGWQKLVELAESSQEIEEIKETYEALLETYPNTASAQIAYINHFLQPGSFSFAESIFKRILRSSPSVELWKFYLTYVRRVNTGPTTRDTVRKSYDFALSHVGQDKDSGEIWMDYIQFLKSGETTTTWEEQQKMDALRKVYHRAVQIPIENVEKIWSDLEAFESNLNKITAKKFMADLTPSYMQARTVLRQLQKHMSYPLFPNPSQSSSSRPVLFLPAPTFDHKDRPFAGAWKAYLKWEESNPLELEEKDKATLITRIQGVYRKAVIRMRFYSEIWFMSFLWHKSVGKQDEALAILKEGIRANPSSFLLNFAYAEALELKKDKEGVYSTYDNLLKVLRAELEILETKIRSADSSLDSIGSNDTLPPPPPPPAQNGLSVTPSLAIVAFNANASFATQPADDRPPKVKPFTERRSQYGVVYTMYIRAARRMESEAAGRDVFKKVRADRYAPWETYEADALMEYHLNSHKDPVDSKGNVQVACRIFEKGLEKFGDELDFVLRYLNFLITINDDTNARALFERVIGNFPGERGRPLWERWARWEYQYGNLESALKLEKRVSEAFPTDPPIKLFARRHQYHEIDTIAARDLGAVPTQTSSGSLNSLTRNETSSSLHGNSSNQVGGINSSQKRPASPDYRRRDDRGSVDYGAGHKRARPLSPPRDRDRDRWDGPPRRRGRSPSGWDRDRDRDGPPPRRNIDRERDEEKPVQIPPIISMFVGLLPTPAAFDGPVFRADDLMNTFRNAVIPSTNARPRTPPPPVPGGPPRGAGRPPPDYGPYQGPGGGRGGRSY